MPAPKGNKHAIGNKGGRPTLYDPKFCQLLRDFFEKEPYKDHVYEESTEYFKDGSLKKKSFKKKPVPNKLPTLFRFAETIGVNKDTIIEWTKKHVEFSDAYNAAKEKQKEFLIGLGLAGATPPAAYIFTAKNVTDMRDKVETDITSKGEAITGINYIMPNVSPNDKT